MKNSERYKLIDQAIKDIHVEDVKDSAGEILLKLFDPLIKSTTNKITEKHKHFDYQDIKARVQYVLIIMAMKFRQPRTDTRAAGRTRGEWASNFNIYARQNLYYFTIVELMKEDDSLVDQTVENKDKPLFVKENVCDVGINDNISAFLMLDKIEDLCGERARDVMMLKALFGFTSTEIAWITGLSSNFIKTIICKVQDKMQQEKDVIL